MIARRALLLGILSAPIAGRAQSFDAGTIPSPGRPPGGALAMPPPLPPAVSSRASLVAAADLGGSVGFAALDAESGAVLASGNPDRLLPPASTLKTVTALYALDRLGAGHRFRTRVIGAGDRLVLAGGGDPLLTTDDLARLADDLIAGGATPPARFAVWGGALPHVETLSPGQARHLAYSPALSGMILNFNRVHLGWRQAGGEYELSVEARADTHSPRAYTVTARAARQAALFAYSADEGREHWTISRAGMGRAGSRWLPVRKPELYAGDVFQTLCRARGLVLPPPEVIEVLPAGGEMAVVESRRLIEIVQGMLEHSTNLTAEALGLHASGSADPSRSAAAMRAWLQQQGVTGEYRFADHSGLSADSRISALHLARTMAGPGRRARLRALMKQDPLAPDGDRGPASRFRVDAKTGTLNFVSTLAGYATGPEDREIAFAILCADSARRAVSEGQELPPGVIGWTKRAKTLQRQLIETFGAPA